MDWVTCQITFELVNNNVHLPAVKGEARVEESVDGKFIVFRAEKLSERLGGRQCKRIVQPTSATARSFTLDLVDHYKYEYIRLTFDNNKELKDFVAKCVDVVGVAEVKKYTSSLTNRQEAPRYVKGNSESTRTTNVLTSKQALPNKTYASTLSSTPTRNENKPSTRGPLQPVLPTNINSTRQSDSIQINQTTRQVPGNVTSPFSNSQQTPVSRKRNLQDTDGESIGRYGYAPSPVSRTESKTSITSDIKKHRKIEPVIENTESGLATSKSNLDELKSTNYWTSETTTTKRGSPEVVNLYESQAEPLFSFTTDIYKHRRMTNLGNSCYMNASLQALASLPLFITELFKAVPEEKYDNQVRRTELLRSVVNVFDHIFSKNTSEPKSSKRRLRAPNRQGNDTAVPRDLLRAVRKAAGDQIDESMGDPTQHDAQEFILRLLDIIADEIDGVSSTKNERPSSDKENREGVYSFDLDDFKIPEKLLEKTYEDSASLPKFKNVVPNKPKESMNPGSLFKVGCYNRLVCNDCGYVSKKKEEGREVQLGMGENNDSIARLVEIQFERHDISWTCTRCASTRACMSTSFENLPEYLIIVLKRYGYQEESGGRKSHQTVKVDRELSLKKFCEGSEHKNAELEKIPPPIKELPEGETIIETPLILTPTKHEDVSVTPQPNSRFFRGYKSPVKPVSREPEFELKFEEYDSQASQDIFDDCEEEIGVDDNGNVASNELTPEPTIEPHPCSPSIIAKQLEESSVVPKPSVDDPYENMDYLQQTGGAVINVNRVSSSRSNTELNNSFSDPAVVYEGKMADSILWKPLIPQRLYECQQTVDEQLMTNSLESLTRWSEEHLDNQPKQIPMHLKRGAFSKKRVNGDGACLFRSFSWWLCQGSEEHNDIIRNKICNFIICFHKEFSALAKKDWGGYGCVEDYVAFMRCAETWGSHLEIAAMATILRCTIYSYHSNSWKKFPPLFLWSRKDGNEEELQKEEGSAVDDVSENGAIYILNTENLHFDPVFAIKEKFVSNDEEVGDFSDNLEDVDPMNGLICPSPPAQLSDQEDEVINNEEEKELENPYIYNEEDEPVYTLSAVVNHKGNYLNHGHYTAYSFDSDRNKWLNCDDSCVSVVSEKYVLEQSTTSGYLFIYRRRHPHDEAEFRISD